MQDLIAFWGSPEWKRDAEEWVLSVLAAEGAAPSSPITELKTRFWSTVWSIETDAGRFWFKENNPAERAEPRVTSVLAGIVPEHVIGPVAVDEQRGRILTRDHGLTLATLPTIDEEQWAAIVRDYAQLQLAVATHREELLVAGLPAFDPADVPEYLDRRIAGLCELPREHPLFLDAPEAAEVAENASRMRSAAEFLVDGPIPLSLEHNDLHQNNVFVPTSDGAPLTFFDFGDALWAHPFASLRKPIALMRDQWDCAGSDPRIERVIDSYLSVWKTFGSAHELRPLVRAAVTVGALHQFETWRKLLLFADPASAAPYRDHVKALLLDS